MTLIWALAYRVRSPGVLSCLLGLNIVIFRQLREFFRRVTQGFWLFCPSLSASPVTGNRQSVLLTLRAFIKLESLDSQSFNSLLGVSC